MAVSGKQHSVGLLMISYYINATGTSYHMIFSLIRRLGIFSLVGT